MNSGGIRWPQGLAGARNSRDGNKALASQAQGAIMLGTFPPDCVVTKPEGFAEFFVKEE
jgi:hypothetical protein